MSAPVAFVIMPFAEQFQSGYRDVIRPAVERAGLRLVRADQEQQGHIHGQLFERILDSAVVIADISGLNPNVFYELGIAHSTSRKVITMARDDFADHVPFDIAPYRALIYPAPPADPADDGQRRAYETGTAAAVEALAAEIRELAQPGAVGIPNPVQAYISSRSPLESSTTRFLPEFVRGLEEEMLRRTVRELIYVSVTGASLSIAGHIESGQRREPLNLKLLALDPDERESWKFLYEVRAGRRVTGEEVDEFLAEDRIAHRRVLRTIDRLAGYPTFTAEVRYYDAPPLFWAYVVDQARLVLGHLALGRLSARNLPVSVIVKQDPSSGGLWTGYSTTIEMLWASSRPRGAKR